MAIYFYKSIADSFTPSGSNTYLKAAISTVGHSLGGELPLYKMKKVAVSLSEGKKPFLK